MKDNKQEYWCPYCQRFTYEDHCPDCGFTTDIVVSEML